MKNGIVLTLKLILAVILTTRKGVVTATLGTPEQQLRHDLLTNYHHDVRPVLKPGDIINITFSYKLARIVTLDIKHQVLTTDAWIVQTWTNPYLRWNESKYGEIHTLHMSPADVWVPDIVLYNNADEDVTLSGFKEKFKTYVIVDSTGFNKWMSPATFKSSCDMRVTFYPFDKQKCHMTFGSWTFDSRLLKMITKSGKHLNTDKYIESGDWDLDDVTVEVVDKAYDCCVHPFSDVTYTFHFERKSLYHVLYQILPCVVIILLVILNFITPPDSGERVSFCITILLAMSVYLLILADSLPETSDDVAILGLYYMATIFLIGFSLVGTVVVLRCNFADGKPSPSLVRFAKVILKRRERIKSGCSNTVFVRSASPPSLEAEQTELPEVKKTEDTHREPTLQVVADSIKEQKEQSECKGAWKEIAEAMDRLFLFIFIAVTAIATLAIWFPRQ